MKSKIHKNKENKLKILSKNLFKTAALALVILLLSCNKDEETPPLPAPTPGVLLNLPGSFIAGEVGNFNYDSRTGGGQTFANKIAIPFAGDQIKIASALGDTKTLNLTFFAPATTGSVDGVCFYSPNGTAVSSIGNDDNCGGVSCTVNVTSNNGKILEGTFTASLKKTDCTGTATPVVGGRFKAVVAQ